MPLFSKTPQKQSLFGWWDDWKRSRQPLPPKPEPPPLRQVPKAAAPKADDYAPLPAPDRSTPRLKAVDVKEAPVEPAVAHPEPVTRIEEARAKRLKPVTPSAKGAEAPPPPPAIEPVLPRTAPPPLPPEPVAREPLPPEPAAPPTDVKPADLEPLVTPPPIAPERIPEPVVPEPRLPEPELMPPPPPEPVVVEPVVVEPKRSFLARLRDGLSRTSQSLGQGIQAIFTKAKLDDETIESLEDALIAADLGVETTTAITSKLAASKYDKAISADEVRETLAVEIGRILEPVAVPLVINAARKPHVILVVGVNGSGKTTTIGKLAAKLKADGKSVVLAAGDTFRAAAIEQLTVWAERVGAPIVARETGADAAGLAFDALELARREGADVLLIDTAGRLQNKSDLMAELEKVTRVIKKLDPEAPHSVLLVLDATVGQNAISQVEIFRDRAKVTGLVMTKLDGTARGGILVALAAKFDLPIHAIGVGESVEDLAPFDPKAFARALVGAEELV